MRYSARWCDRNGFAVPDSLQRTLNHEWLNTYGNAATMTADELTVAGDKLRDSASYAATVKYYEKACEADFTFDRVAYLLPRISSCYRLARQPAEAIKLFSYAAKQFGREIMTAELLTVAGAAYCDLGEYENAGKCCNRAYAKLGGYATDELADVYRRINRES